MNEAPTSEIPYTVRRSSRARRVRVNVHAHAGVEVVLPARAPERAAASAVRELRPWIEARLAEARTAMASVADRAGTLPYLGATLQLVPEAGRSRAHLRGERLLVPATDPGPAIERFYRRAARTEIAPRLDRASALAGHSYSGLDIRGQRTRWASCSSTGRMSFNWRLLLAPEGSSNTSSGTRSATSRCSTTHPASGRWWSAIGPATGRTASGWRETAPRSSSERRPAQTWT